MEPVTLSDSIQVAASALQRLRRARDDLQAVRRRDGLPRRDGQSLRREACAVGMARSEPMDLFPEQSSPRPERRRLLRDQWSLLRTPSGLFLTRTEVHPEQPSSRPMRGQWLPAQPTLRPER